jgi:hypothetical protein
MFSDYPASLRDGGAIVVSGELDRDGVNLGANRRIQVTITTSGGDIERIGLWHARGGRGTAWDLYFSTLAFEVVGASGVDAVEFEQRFRDRGLVPVRLSMGWLQYQILTFDPLRIAQVAAEVRRWSEVAILEMTPGLIFSTHLDRGVVAPLKVQYHQPRRRDGVLQVALGDTLRAQFVNPNGDTLHAMTVMPSVPPGPCDHCVAPGIRNTP